MATRDQRRSKPSRRELELSEAEKRKIVEKYGLDIEDYDDLMKMGPRLGSSAQGTMALGGLTPGGVVAFNDDNPKATAWDRRLKELQDRAAKRRATRQQKEQEDYEARIRGVEPPTQAEVRKVTEAAPQTTTQTPVATTTVPAQPATLSTPVLNPAGGTKRGRSSTHTPLVSVGENDRTGTTVTVNGQGMRPTTENGNLVNEPQRRQLLDAPTGVDVTSPLYTNAEVRLMRRRAAEIQRYRDIKAEAIAARARADETARSKGALRNADDWKYYGTVANTGGDDWKKGGKSYDEAMDMLRGKIKSLQELGTAGYTPSSGKAIADLVTMIEDSDKLGGLSQRQIEVANGLVNGWASAASSRKEMHEAEEKSRINAMRRTYGIAEGTPDKDVLAAVRTFKGKAVSAALDALSNPDTWNTPDYYTHLETIQKNAGPNEGLASSFSTAMRDPTTRQRYNDAVMELTGGGVLPDDTAVANLQNKFAVEHMLSRRSSVQAASKAGSASGSLRPRKVYGSDKERYRDMSVAEKLARAGELLKKYEGTDKYDAFKKRYDAMVEKYGPQVRRMKQDLMEAVPSMDPKTAEAIAERMPWDYERRRIMIPQIGRPDGTVDYDKINEIASSPIPERVTRTLGTRVAPVGGSQAPSYQTDLGGLGAPGTLWLQPLRPRGKGVL